MNQTIKSLMFVAILAGITGVGCGESTQEKIEERTDSMASKIEQGMDNLGDRVGGDSDEDFLEDAMEANADELHLLALGAQKGGKDVKDAANRMMKDHKQLGADVKAYLAQKNITLTDVDTAEHDDDMADRSAGADFDKAFADKMVSDHEKVVRMFEDHRDDAKDPDLKNMIEKALPTLRAHLDMSRTLQNKVNQ